MMTRRNFYICVLITLAASLLNVGLQRIWASDPDSAAEAKTQKPETDLLYDPNIAETPELPEWKTPKGYWQPRYHPQVSTCIFRVLRYPYYHNGNDYPLSDLATLTPPVETPPVLETNPSDPNLQSSQQDKLAIEVDSLRFAVERCCDLIHQWRSLNESAGTAMEVLRTVQLTRTTTNIYRIQPKLAVRVKRTIGRIGRINQNFDLTSRLALREVLLGNGKTMILRMEKQLADVRSMLERLADQNDQIGIALGVGKFDRSLPGYEPLDYSNLQVPVNNYFVK